MENLDFELKLRNVDFKIKFAEKIEEFLRNRMEAYDGFRLYENFSSEKKNQFMTTDEVYERYKELNEGKESESMRIRNYKDSVPIGETVTFTIAEKDKIFAIVKEYLMTTDIVCYPNSRDDSCFLTDILEEIINCEANPKELREELKKYLVSLYCIHDFLSFYNDYPAYISSESGHFFIQDHRGERFVSYDAMNPEENSISDFTPIISNSALKIFSIKIKENKEDANLFGIYGGGVSFGNHDDAGYHDFLSGVSYSKENYHLDYSCSMHKYLKEMDCEFLEKGIYDPTDIDNIIGSGKRFREMSVEEKEHLHEIATMAAKFVLGRYEYFALCDNNCQAYDLAKGYVSKEEIYEFGQKEQLFIETLRDEIKAKLLEEDFIRLTLEHTSVGVIRRVYNKSELHFPTVFEEVVVYSNSIVFQNVEKNKEIIYSKNKEFYLEKKLK